PTTFTYHPPPSTSPPIFDPAASWSGSSVSSNPPVEADFDGDGRTDFLVASRSGNTVSMYLALANPTGGFSAPAGTWSWSNTPPVGTLATWDLTFGDYNGDHRTDFMLSYRSNAAGGSWFRYYIGYSNSNGTFSMAGPYAHNIGLGSLPSECAD